MHPKTEQTAALQVGLRQLKAAAKEFGATVEDDSGGRWTVYQVVSPFGRLWNAIDCKHIKIEFPAGTNRADKAEAFADGIARIICGTRPMNASEAIECDEGRAQ